MKRIGLINADKVFMDAVYRSHAPALVVIHKSIKARHPGRDCRDPEHRDVNVRFNCNSAL